MLGHGRHALAEHKRNVWFVTVEGDVTKDELLRPSYWAPMSASGKVRPCDEIIVFPDTGEWRLVFHVVMANQNGLTLALLQENEFADAAQSVEADAIGFKVKWNGPNGQWAVINRANNEAVREKIPSKEQAFQMIRDLTN